MLKATKKSGVPVKEYPLSDKTIEQRKAESTKIKSKFPDRIPVLVAPATETSPVIDKQKFLVPSDLTVGQFIYIIRKRIQLPAEKAIFIFVGTTLPPTASLMSSIYAKYKNEDGFLYIAYSDENTFGGN